jgi:hypothetical protein
MIDRFDQTRERLRLNSLLSITSLHHHVDLNVTLDLSLEDQRLLRLDDLPQWSQSTEERLGIDRRLVVVDLLDSSDRRPRAQSSASACCEAREGKVSPQDVDERLGVDHDCGVVDGMGVLASLGILSVLRSEQVPAAPSSVASSFSSLPSEESLTDSRPRQQSPRRSPMHQYGRRIVRSSPRIG